MAQDRRKGRVELAKRIVKQAGHSVKEIADREIAKHEKRLHKGATPTFKHGGHVKGELPRHRLDRKARGGANKGKAHTAVNIVIADGKPPQGGLGAPAAPVPAPRPAAVAAPAAPVPASPPALPLQPVPVAPPQPQQRPMMNKGGRVPAMKFGAGGGKGRLEKSKSYGK